ncbi:CDP-alcohol phosphatidyltransferase family protein [Pararhizobium sp. BT-229]|uniref:CDP-alcohol phosphatidyltransferase family protein n=1 Tax=Pararhizobium sp. BT-229 TaxID=2986923 RepID=UPI0021F7393C|nr:CDP-alcohol phosphatidyltransferase family protein [Pararhizobium sp. BT-229]MCV9962541.1 CDP-alcohol phosphatidyltransferase family protein [Pararhizobium sp. BT-229]
MLDGHFRRRLDPWLDRAGRALAARGIGANTVTVAGFLIGLAAAIAIILDAFAWGFILIAASRTCDGLDGAVARATAKTDFGGFLDIVLDFAFYGLIPFAFIFADPYENGVAGGLLLLSFYVNGASFLAFAVMAEKRGLSTDVRGVKSLYFTTGLAEATETIAVFLAFCLFPHCFSEIAIAFALICFYTALSRIMLARASFKADAQA